MTVNTEEDILIEEELALTAATAGAAPINFPKRFTNIFPAFAFRNYQLYFAGHAISIIGFWLQQVGLGWHIFQLTHSAFWLGAVTAVGGLPILIVTPFAGVVIDKVNKQKLITITQTCEMTVAIIFGLLIFAEKTSLPLILFLVFVNGLIHSFDLPTRQSFVIEMVGKKALASAISLNNSLFNGARFIGPAIAGVMVATLGVGWTFILNGLSFLPAILAILKIRPLYAYKAEVETHPWQSFKTGLVFSFTHPKILYFMILATLTAIFIWPYQTLMPIVAQNVYNSGAHGLGIFLASAGLGSLIGAIFVSSQSHRQNKGPIVLTGLLVASISFMLFGINRNFLLANLLLFIGGFGVLVQVSSTNTLVQLLSPDALRGRIIAVYLTMFIGMMPLGNALAGIIAQKTSAPFAIGLGAFIFLLFGLFLYFKGIFANFTTKI